MSIRGVLGARGGINGPLGIKAGTTAPFLYATTAAPAQTVTIHRITPTGGSITIYWGDGGTTTVLAGDTANKSHVYAAAATYEIRVDPLLLVTQLDIHDSKLSGFRSEQLTGNAMTYFFCYSIGATKANVVNSADMTTWNPTTWVMYSMPAGTYVVNSADMAGWNPTTWVMLSMPAGTYVVNSADMTTWNPTTWVMYSMPAGTYVVNSSDMTTWNPTDWRLFLMPAGTYVVNSADMATWNPTDWRLFSMPAGTYVVNTADMATWNPTTWYLLSMPAGTYVINTADMATWNPTNLYLYLMPAASTTWTIAANDLSGFTKTTTMRAENNALNQAQVNAILWGLYQASATPRTGVGGTINVSGSNAAPSGIYQPAAACPVTVATPGKEVAHELLNDGCGAGFNVWTTVTFTP